jgi:hypothetical protein
MHMVDHKPSKEHHQFDLENRHQTQLLAARLDHTVAQTTHYAQCSFNTTRDHLLPQFCYTGDKGVQND